MHEPRRAPGEAAFERNHTRVTRRGDGSVPELVVWRGPDPDVFYMWCKFCQRFHTHGATEGHRIAHCDAGGSPYTETGYYLVDIGWTLTSSDIARGRPPGLPARATPAGETTLYRCFDADGGLLYVGIAASWPTRLRQHQRNSTWFDLVASLTVERWATRDEAARAEETAIKIGRPRFNITHAARPL